MVRLKNEIKTKLESKQCSTSDEILNNNSCKCDCDDCSDDIKNHSTSAFAEYTLYPSQKLPKNDELMTCPNCQSAIITKKKYNAVIYTHLLAILLLPLLSCWIPYVFKCFKVISHRCPYCDVQLGVSTIC